MRLRLLLILLLLPQSAAGYDYIYGSRLIDATGEIYDVELAAGSYWILADNSGYLGTEYNEDVICNFRVVYPDETGITLSSGVLSGTYAWLAVTVAEEDAGMVTVEFGSNKPISSILVTEEQRDSIIEELGDTPEYQGTVLTQYATSQSVNDTGSAGTTELASFTLPIVLLLVVPLLRLAVTIRNNRVCRVHSNFKI